MRRFALVLVGLFAVASYAADNDPNLWLTDIHGAKPLAWVKQQNARSDAAIKSDPQFAKDRASILTVLNADDRIPEGTLDHQWVFDFWQDAGHVRGIWRRTTIADFASKTPHWQTLLDVDELDRDQRVLEQGRPPAVLGPAPAVAPGAGDLAGAFGAGGPEGHLEPGQAFAFQGGEAQAAGALEALRRERSGVERRLVVLRDQMSRAELEESQVRGRLESLTDTVRRELDCEPESLGEPECPPLPAGTSAPSRARELEREAFLEVPAAGYVMPRSVWS